MFLLVLFCIDRGELQRHFNNCVVVLETDRKSVKTVTEEDTKTNTQTHTHTLTCGVPPDSMKLIAALKSFSA